MPLSHFYYVLGMLFVVIPMAITLAIVLLDLIAYLRHQRRLQARKLLLLCLIAMVPALLGVALIYVSGGSST
ncbi:hypothetical protein [Carnimonas nigrificans]|uniref:hypothetical protein n=1 Tax=Carnimonas nigrificans TaxID=64323 RepID=UPI000470CCB1|nr:hypothetical protein [Carnimonas nigrificans]